MSLTDLKQKVRIFIPKTLFYLIRNLMIIRSLLYSLNPMNKSRLPWESVFHNSGPMAKNKMVVDYWNLFRGIGPNRHRRHFTVVNKIY